MLIVYRELKFDCLNIVLSLFLYKLGGVYF